MCRESISLIAVPVLVLALYLSVPRSALADVQADLLVKIAQYESQQTACKSNLEYVEDKIRQTEADAAGIVVKGYTGYYDARSYIQGKQRVVELQVCLRECANQITELRKRLAALPAPPSIAAPADEGRKARTPQKDPIRSRIEAALLRLSGELSRLQARLVAAATKLASLEKASQTRGGATTHRAPVRTSH